MDPQLCMLFKRHAIFTDTQDPFEAQVVNLYANAARLMWREYPLDWDALTSQDPRSVHLVILGFGHTGESAAAQAAAVGHFANGAKLRISVVDMQAEAKHRAFHGRYPHFNEVADIRFVHGDVGDPKTLDLAAAWSEEPQAVTTILIAVGSDSRGAVVALDLLARIEPGNPTPILIRMAERPALAMLFHVAGTDSSWRRRVHVVGLIQQVCTCDMLLDKELDVLARAIHNDYVTRRRKEGRPADDPSLAPWDVLEQSRKDGNRRQADHIPVKLRAIGCQAFAAETAGAEANTFAFADEEIELLAHMEHARWKAHRHLTGWVRGPEYDPCAKISPHLCPWEELDEARKEMSREPVRNIPFLLGLVGQRVERMLGASVSRATAG